MAEKDKTWRLLEILNRTTDYLKERDFPNPRLEAELLLCHTLSMTRVDLYLNYDRPLHHQELTKFKSYLLRRITHEPLQYITGEAEFMSLKFKVNREVMIPRPETEVLVERTIERCKNKFDTQENLSLLDIGTGSGNIAVSLAKYLENAQVTAVDVNPRALQLAYKNAQLNGVKEKIKFIQADVLNANFPQKVGTGFDVLVSNPPYISSEEFKRLPQEVRKFEPKKALYGGVDGLLFFRHIADVSRSLLKQRGFILIEIGLGQGEETRRILKEKGFKGIRSYPDLNGVERVIYGELGF